MKHELLIEISSWILFILGSIVMPGLRGNAAGFILIFIPIPLAGLLIKFNKIKILLNTGHYFFGLGDLLKLGFSNSWIYAVLLWAVSGFKLPMISILAFFLMTLIVSTLFFILSLRYSVEKSFILVFTLLIVEVVLVLFSDTVPPIMLGHLIYKEPDLNTLLQFGIILATTLVLLTQSLRDFRKADFIGSDSFYPEFIPFNFFYLKTFLIRVGQIILLEIIMVQVFRSLWSNLEASTVYLVQPTTFWLSDLVFMLFNFPLLLILGNSFSELIKKPMLLSQAGIKKLIAVEIVHILTVTVAVAWLRTLLPGFNLNWLISLSVMVQMIPILFLLNFVTSLFSERNVFLIAILMIAISLLLTRFTGFSMLPDTFELFVKSSYVMVPVILWIEYHYFSKTDFFKE
ncbi:MAG: hypothetical protein GX833_08740 [Clostridium sp.]|jgi:hypothetical protein|nr:hypothetical protein [Clostridium sp.]